jgi:hypothetical protein
MSIIITPAGHRLGYRKAGRFHSMLAKVSPPLSGVTLLESNDLSHWSPIIVDQGQVGKCTGDSTKKVAEIIYGVVVGKILQDLRSGSYAYAKTRQAEGTFPHDAGAMMADEFSIGQVDGFCAASVFPEDSDPTVIPPPEADASAALFRFPNPTLVAPTQSSIKTVLSFGRPIGISMPVFPSFENVGADGMAPLPDPSETSLGGHGLCLSGFDPDGMWIDNSWGTGWGKSGRVHLPWGYEQNFWELYTDCSAVSDFSLPQ